MCTCMTDYFELISGWCRFLAGEVVHFRVLGHSCGFLLMGLQTIQKRKCLKFS